MKKLILGALAAAMVASPLATSVASAQSYGQRTVTTIRERPNGRTVVTQRTVDRQPGYRTWRPGERFIYRQAPHYGRITRYQAYRLHAPQRGHYWARSGRDAVLVRPNGTVVEVRQGLFR